MVHQQGAIRGGGATGVKPEIVEIIGEQMDLRPAGRELVGLCPFHDDRRPSLYVNVARQLFLCRACGVGGDVIEFVRRLDGLTYPEALRALGIDSEPKRRPPLTPSRKRAAELAAAWVNTQRARFTVMIADALECRDLADEIGNFELAEDFDRELIILRAFYNSLEHPRSAAEMLSLRESIEQITQGAEVSL